MYAQSSYVSTHLENPDVNAVHLLTLPWDETRLYQLTVDVSTGFYMYTIDDVSYGTVVPLTIPLCSQVRGIPVVFDDGMLLPGNTTEGLELIYFDGNTSTVFDINAGNADGIPDIFELDDRIFVLGFDGSFRQLYEFSKVTHTLTKITNEQISVQAVCATWGADVYYSTFESDASTMQTEYSLMKASPNGNSFNISTIQAILTPNDPMRFIDWRSPVLKWGSLHLAAVNFHITGIQTSTMGVIIVDANSQVSTINQFIPINSGEFKLIDTPGALHIYSDGHNEVFSSSDDVTYSSTSIPANNYLKEHYVSDNGELYFMSLHPDDSYEIFRFENGFQSKHVNDHLHFLRKDSEVLYFSNYSQFDSSSIVLLYTGIDVVDEVNVNVGFHSPSIQSSVIFNGLFTFLFASGGVADDNDIFQLIGSPSAGMDDLSLETTVYPNPVSTGDDLFIESNSDGTGKVFTSNGRMLMNVTIHPGTNRIDTAMLTSGVYFIQLNGQMSRFVVN